MSTAYITALMQADKKAIMLAAEHLKNDEVVAIPTETVYGLAANSLSDVAVKKIFAAKSRPADNPLISHISDMSMLKMLVDDVPADAVKLANLFWPGPLTLVLKRGGKVCNTACANMQTVAVRMPNHKVALDIIKAAGVPLAAPSANVSGRPSPTDANAVKADMDGKIPLVIDGGNCTVGVESTVLSLVGDEIVILRPGFITKEQIESAVNKEVSIAKSAENMPKEGEKVMSPGMKYKHYAPNTKIVLVGGSSKDYCNFVNKQTKGGQKVLALCFTDEKERLICPVVAYGKMGDDAEQARLIFAALREVDTHGADIAYAHCPNNYGVGSAVYNRMLRAASFEVLYV